MSLCYVSLIDLEMGKLGEHKMDNISAGKGLLKDFIWAPGWKARAEFESNLLRCGRYFTKIHLCHV